MRGDLLHECAFHSGKLAFVVAGYAEHVHADRTDFRYSCRAK